MASPERRPFPFRVTPLGDETQRRVSQRFAALPSGLVSCNHWGFRLAGTTTDRDLEELYNHPLDAHDTWVVTPPKCGTHWTMEMVWLLGNDLDYQRAQTPLIPIRWVAGDSRR